MSHTPLQAKSTFVPTGLLLIQQHASARLKGTKKVARLLKTRKTSINIACILASCMGLTACLHSTLPNLDQTLPEHWQHTQAPSVAAANAVPPTPDLHHWWLAFHSPDLDTLIAQSLAQNLTLAAAREHIHAARIVTNHTRSYYLPDAHFSTDDIPDPSEIGSYFRAGFDTSWELGLFGKKAANQQITDGQLADVQAQAQMAQVSLVAEVVRNWVLLRTAQQQVNLMNQMIQATQQQLQLTNARTKLGLSPKSDLHVIRSTLAEQNKARDAKQLEIDDALQQLALLQGRSTPDPAWSTLTTLPVVGDFTTQTVPADIIQIRPDIQQAQAEVLEAAGQYGMARAARYPTITLAGAYMYSFQLLGHFSFHDADTNSLGTYGPLIDIPLFDWGQRKAAADARNIELKAAVLNYKQTVLTAVSEVESSIAAVHSEQQRVLEQHEVVSAAKQNLKARQNLINLGLSSPLEGLQEQQAAQQAVIELCTMQMQQDLAYIAVYKALGGAPVDTDQTGDQANGSTPAQATQIQNDTSHSSSDPLAASVQHEE